MLTTPSSIPSGDSFYADMRIFNVLYRRRSYTFDLGLMTVLELIVYVDGAVLEVCANNKTVISAVALPSLPNSTGVGIFGVGANSTVAIEAHPLKSLY